MADWVMRLIAEDGHAAVVFLMFLENAFPPIPSELILPLAGYMARRHQLSFSGVMFASTLGSVLGSLPLYIIGRRISRERIEAFVDRHHRWTTVTRADVARVHGWFQRHRARAVIVCRILPGARGLISLPAGVERMNVAAFIACTAIGSFAWNATLAAIGYLLGGGYKVVDQYLNAGSWIALGAMVAWYFWRVLRG